MSKIEGLIRLEAVLEEFLEQAAEVGLERVESGKSVEALGDIARESLRGRFVANRLGDWLAKNKRHLERNRFDSSNLTTIGNYLQDIKTGLEEDDPETPKLTEEIESWKKAGAKPRKKIVLKRGFEEIEASVTEKFLKGFALQAEVVDYYKEKKMHLLSMLEDTLKAAEAKTDQAYLHLAGSLIYFLKINGYKVDPYVKKLKSIEESRKKL